MARVMLLMEDTAVGSNLSHQSTIDVVAAMHDTCTDCVAGMTPLLDTLPRACSYVRHERCSSDVWTSIRIGC